MPDGLRPATPGDIEVIAALERTCFGADDGIFSRRQLQTLIRNPRAYWLLAEDGGAMACWLAAANGQARWARLYSLAVHPDQRGRGLAGHLLRAGFDWMRAQNLAVCRAEVKVDNIAARALYARVGFREIARLPDYYAPGQDGVRLVIDLGRSRVAQAA